VKKVEDFEEFITTLGYSLGTTGRTVTPKQFQKLIDRIRGHTRRAPHRGADAADDAEGAL
jgi:exoribonuclease R